MSSWTQIPKSTYLLEETSPAQTHFFGKSTQEPMSGRFAASTKQENMLKASSTMLLTIANERSVIPSLTWKNRNPTESPEWPGMGLIQHKWCKAPRDPMAGGSGSLTSQPTLLLLGGLPGILPHGSSRSAGWSAPTPGAAGEHNVSNTDSVYFPFIHISWIDTLAQRDHSKTNTHRDYIVWQFKYFSFRKQFPM